MMCPQRELGKRVPPFLLASRSEGCHIFFLVSNSLMYYIPCVFIRFIMGIFVLMESKPI